MITILASYQSWQNQQQLQQQNYCEWIYLHHLAAYVDCDACCVCAFCDATIDF